MEEDEPFEVPEVPEGSEGPEGPESPGGPEAPGSPDEAADYATSLPDEEREDVEADIEDLDAMRSVFEPQGAKGVVITCSECGENHYYGWDLLKESLEFMLKTGEPRMHEPAYEPREDDYVVWDYAKGYVDALADAGLDDSPSVEVTECGWCDTPVEAHFQFCPRCGRSMALIRLFRTLVERGMDERELRALVIRSGFEPLA